MASPVQYPAPVETVRLPTAVIAGTTNSVSVATLKTLAGAGNAVYTFTAAYMYERAGAGPLHFKNGESYILDLVLKTALLALSAPMVAA